MPDATALQFAPPEPQRDAADRLSRLHGALELKSALLALILPLASKRATRAFEIETEGARQAPGILVHVRNLPPAARLPWYDELLRRMALQSMPIRQELLQATRRVMGARGVARPIDRLHWLAMRRGLGEKTASFPPPLNRGASLSRGRTPLDPVPGRPAAATPVRRCYCAPPPAAPPWLLTFAVRSLSDSTEMRWRDASGWEATYCSNR